MKKSNLDILAALNVSVDDDQREAILQLLDEAVDDAMSQVCDARAFNSHGELAARAGALAWARMFRERVVELYETAGNEHIQQSELPGGY